MSFGSYIVVNFLKVLKKADIDKGLKLLVVLKRLELGRLCLVAKKLQTQAD